MSITCRALMALLLALFASVGINAQESAKPATAAVPGGLSKQREPSNGRYSVADFPQAQGAAKTLAMPPLSGASVEGHTSGRLERLESDAREVVRTQQQVLDKLEAYRPTTADKWITAGVALASSLLGGFITWLIQWTRLKSDRKAAQQAAGVKELAETYRYRSKQLNEFYAPMEALLRQGLHVRNELYDQLLAANAVGIAFKKVNDDKSANGWSLWIDADGQASRPFKLLHDLPMLRQKFPSNLTTVGETVRINELIVKLIHEKVGLVRHENVKLSQLIGAFLAHQAVLMEVYSSPDSTQVPKYATVFPRELRGLIEQDASQLRQELSEWDQRVKRWAEGVPASHARC